MNKRSARRQYLTMIDDCIEQEELPLVVEIEAFSGQSLDNFPVIVRDDKWCAFGKLKEAINDIKQLINQIVSTKK